MELCEVLDKIDLIIEDKNDVDLYKTIAIETHKATINTHSRIKWHIYKDHIEYEIEILNDNYSELMKILNNLEDAWYKIERYSNTNIPTWRIFAKFY